MFFCLLLCMQYIRVYTARTVSHHGRTLNLFNPFMMLVLSFKKTLLCSLTWSLAHHYDIWPSPTCTIMTGAKPLYNLSSYSYLWILSCSSERHAQHSHLINTWSKKGTALTSDQHMIEERHSTYIWSTHDRRKAQHLYLSNTWSKKGSALTFIQAGTHSTTMMKGLTLISDHEGTHPNNHIRMAPSPWLSYLVTDQVPPFS